jgi:MFS family permease
MNINVFTHLHPRKHLRRTRMNTDTPKAGRLPRNVVILGLVSLLNDFASEMVVPLIPLLLVTVLAAGPATLGAIEGSAELLANLLKLWSGRLSDRLGRRRKPFVITGYWLSNLARPLMGFSGHWMTVLVIRLTDRAGKGLRTAPRDALIADSVDDAAAGRAYGLTRALDHAGAVLGALAAAAVLHWGTQRLAMVIALSAVPGMLAVALIAVGVREPDRPPRPPLAAPALFEQRLHPSLRRYLLLIALFALGRIPDTFLLLRGHELGLSPVSLLLLWAGLHAQKSLVAEIVGRFAIRARRRGFILAGWVLYALALTGLGGTESIKELWYFALMLGGYAGLTESAERAVIRDLAPAGEVGTAFGWYHMLSGVAAVLGGVGLGGLWSLYGSAPMFFVSAAMASLCVLLLGVFRPNPARPAPQTGPGERG